MAQTRRRGAELEEAILRAAADELAESGYPGVTMDRVAQRAGTNKNAIYRRWPNRAALGIAAYQLLVRDNTHVPDTGELRGDVLATLRHANEQLSSPNGDILRGLLASMGEEPELLAALHERMADGGSELWLTILRRAVERGEVAETVLKPRIATVAIVLLRNEYVTRGITSVPDAVIVEIVDDVYLPLVECR